jgi:hypothetical protein
MLGPTVERIEIWRSIIADAKSITNVADRAFVLLEICGAMPSKFMVEQKLLLKEARASISEIPSVHDKYSRLDAFIDVARTIDTFEAKSALKEAMLLTFDLEEEDEASRHRRSLLDIAEIMQPGMADELAKLCDDDPAREAAKEDLEKSVKVQKLRKQIASVDDEPDTKDLGVGTLPAAAWNNVGSLVSNRLEAKQPDKLASYVDAAGTFSLKDAFPVISWFIENSARRFTTPSMIAKNVLPIAEVLLLSLEIAVSVMNASQHRLLALATLPSLESGQTGLLVRPGERDQAILYIREWLKQHATIQLVYADPFFTHKDIEFLRLVLSEKPELNVIIITSKKMFNELHVTFDKQLFQQAWKAVIDQDPPVTEVVAVTRAGFGDSLIHDRWIISNGEGLRIGTSFNSLGVAKLSEISHLTTEEVNEVSAEMGKFIKRERVISGSRVEYDVVYL